MDFSNITAWFNAFLKQAEVLITKSEFWYSVQEVTFVITVALGLGLALAASSERRRQRAIFNVDFQARDRINFLKDVLFKDLRNGVVTLSLERGRTLKQADTIFYAVIVMLGGIGVFLFFMKQILLAFLLPLALAFALSKLTVSMAKSFNDYVEAELPILIDNVLRTFSRYNDLRSIIYEASLTVENPLGKLFGDLSTKMLNVSPDIALTEFAEQNNNIWIHSFCFILNNYIESAEKKIVLQNLRDLRDIIEAENKSKNKDKLEKRMTIAINYALCVLGIIGLVLNLMFNPIGAEFFFASFGGLMCFLAGIALIVTTVFSNLMLGSGK